MGQSRNVVTSSRSVFVIQFNDKGALLYESDDMNEYEMSSIGM